jgi:DNA-binding CsgD family transcriptional regulator/PAS domain-containing protein
MTSFATTDDVPAQLLDQASGTVSVAVAVVDLKSRTVVAVSPMFSDLVGSAAEVDLHVLVDDPEVLGPLMDLFIGGAIDAYEVRRQLDLGGGRRLWADCWLAVCERERRGHALWALSPVDDDGPGYRADGGPGYRAEPTLLPLPWPGRVSGLVVGAFDAEWCIQRVSLDIEAVLGYPLAEAVGSSLIHIVHPDDVARFLDTAAHCLADGAAVSADLRVAHRDSTWRSAHMVIAPVAPGYLRFGFAIAVQKPDEAEPLFRVADLERALWRIAQEVEDAGVGAGFARLPDTASVPGLEHLSGRQWEIMTKLLAGERAPAIARALNLSQSTVRNTLSDIFAKLHVHSQEELLHVLRPEAPSRPGAGAGQEKGGLSR